MIKIDNILSVMNKRPNLIVIIFSTSALLLSCIIHTHTHTHTQKIFFKKTTKINSSHMGKKQERKIINRIIHFPIHCMQCLKIVKNKSGRYDASMQQLCSLLLRVHALDANQLGNQERETFTERTTGTIMVLIAWNYLFLKLMNLLSLNCLLNVSRLFQLCNLRRGL